MGPIYVRVRYRHPATPENTVGKKCPASTETWEGAVQVVMAEQTTWVEGEEPPGEVRLQYREMACKLSTPGWERVCTAPETYGPQLDSWHRYELGFRIEGAELLDRLDETEARYQRGGFYFITVKDTPPGFWPDAKTHGWQPGQYLLRLPRCGNLPQGVPLIVYQWHDAISDTPSWPTIRKNLDPRFDSPWGEIHFTPGNFKALKFEEHDSLCDDEARFLDDGRIMEGELYCRHDDTGGQILINQARWDLERVDCEDARVAGPPEDWEWPDDPGVEEEWTRPERPVVTPPRPEEGAD